jgi:cysteine synthase
VDGTGGAAGRRPGLERPALSGADRYRHSYDDDAWLAAQGLDLAPHTATLHRFLATGEWTASP